MLARWNGHVNLAKRSNGRRSHFAAAIRKYGKDAFSHEVLEVCSDLEVANLAEECWIELLDTRNHERGFNLARGGGSQPHPLRMNPWNDPEYRAKQVLVDKSHLHSFESNERRRATYSTPESKRKRSEISKAISGSPEARAKNSEAHIGIIFTQEHRDKIAENMKRLHATTPANSRKERSATMHIILAERRASRTAEEVRADAELRSARSKSLNTIAATHSPEARQRHREKCAKLSPLDIGLIRLLRTDGFTQTEIAQVFGVDRKAVSYHERRL